ncbi:MAG: Thiosulfate sulfurtransferase, partial [Tardiphaga sp.]|nr:Thiosulfate sulfurtransferase [Tardiphaga sp.]
VRMYFGSWIEWSRDAKYPIEEGLPLVGDKQAQAA